MASGEKMNMRVAGLLAMATVIIGQYPRWAEADMVVIATTAPNIDLSMVVEPGAKLDLPEGAQVTLLSIDGSMQTIVGPGGMAGVDAAAGEEGDGRMVDALSQIVRQTRNNHGLGAIRGDGGRCDGIHDLAQLLDLGCRRDAAIRIGELAEQVPPALFIGTQKPGSEPVFTLGETIDITLQSNFDGYVYCFHEGSDGTTTRLVPLSGAAPMLRSGNAADLAGELGGYGPLVASEPVGVDRLACFATDRDLAPEESDLVSGPPALGTHQLDGRVRQSFEAQGVERTAHAIVRLEIIR